MDAIIERCAGLDVHQATVVACVLIGEAGRKPGREIRTFPAMTRNLEELRNWLKGKRGRRQTLRGGSLRARLNGPARVDAWRLGCRKVMADQAAGAAV